VADTREQALREAGEILADQADDMVTAWRVRLGDLPFMRPYSGHPDGAPNPEYGTASKPRFDRFIIDACTRPLDQDWLNSSAGDPDRRAAMGRQIIRVEPLSTYLRLMARPREAPPALPDRGR
jgi:hypothetical protein